MVTISLPDPVHISLIHDYLPQIDSRQYLDPLQTPIVNCHQKKQPLKVTVKKPPKKVTRNSHQKQPPKIVTENSQRQKPPPKATIKSHRQKPPPKTTAKNHQKSTNKSHRQKLPEKSHLRKA